MGEPGKLQRVLTPLFQDVFDLEPLFPEMLFLRDTMEWSLSILTGRFQGKQSPLTCDANSQLFVNNDTWSARFAALPSMQLNTAAMEVSLFSIEASAIAQALDIAALLVIFSAVYDPVGGYLKTHETA